MHIFEVVDKTGRTIYCTHERWSHILEHPETPQPLELIKEALTRPDVIEQDIVDPQVHEYYKWSKTRKQWFLVPVKYLNGKGFIITSFYTSKRT